MQKQIKRKVKVNFPEINQTIRIIFSLPDLPEKDLQKVINEKRNKILQKCSLIIKEHLEEINEMLKDEELKNKKRFKRKIKESLQKLKFNKIPTENSISNDLTNAYNKIKREIDDIIKMSKISKYTKEYFTNNPYLESFPMAREMKRKFIFHCGPTNSGKTYAAMEMLKQSKDGVYLGPLRLLATEVSDDLNKQGFPTSLITGEERKIKTGDRYTSSTIEMASFTHKTEIAIIDEVQMISDDLRGWAWTQAIVGLPSETIILAGSEDALPNVKHLVEDILKEELEIVNFKRKNELKVEDRFVKFEKGDAIIVFSRKDVLKLKDILPNSSVLYGSLSPEVRKKEADKFREGKTDYVIATDAIGMGLNLPIKRVVFNSIEKFNGTEMEILPSHLLKQISGRAGRFGKFECGFVTGTSRMFLPFIKKSLKQKFDTEPLEKFQISPNLVAMTNISNMFEINDISEILRQFKTVMLNDEHFEMMNLDNMIEVSSYVNKKLPLDIKFAYTCAPVNLKDGNSVFQIEKWSKKHSKNEEIFLEDTCLNYKNIYGTVSEELLILENTVKNCNTYLWLSMRFPEIYVDTKNVLNKIEKMNNKIIDILGKK